MRRLSPLLIVAVLLVVVLPAAARGLSVIMQQDAPFATNTPRPAPPAFSLATNTPPGPTATATATLTPSATATATATATPTATDTPSPTPTVIGPRSYPDGISPLTGLPYPNEEAATRRNLIIKVSNYPPIVRPQSGLNSADVVFEYEVEGGVTRFAAIFRDNTPAHVGPVRSARLVDLELAPMYQALLGYSGASEPVQRMILTAEWRWWAITPSIGDNCEEAGYCRFPNGDLPYEHTLYVNTALVWQRATSRNVNTGYRARGFAFNETPDANGTPTNDVFVNWYGQTSVRWQYNPATGRYVRFTEGVPHYDAADGQQLWTDNIVILEVPHVNRPDLFEPESRSNSIGIELWDSGRAILVRDGVSYQGFWRRRDREPGSAIELFYGNNAPIMMKPGRSYVQIVRWLGDTTLREEPVDAVATADVLRLSATPTPFTLPSATATPTAATRAG